MAGFPVSSDNFNIFHNSKPLNFNTNHDALRNILLAKHFD